MNNIFPRTKILLLGSGELGKEVAIEAMRLGCEVVACDLVELAPHAGPHASSYAAAMLVYKMIGYFVSER